MIHYRHIFTCLMWLMTAIPFCCMAQQQDESTDTIPLRILALGNSYSIDALAYVPKVMASCYPNVDLTLEILYYAKRSIDNNYHHLNDQLKYEPMIWKGGKWHLISSYAKQGIRFEDAFVDQTWDYVVFQEFSLFSDDYSKCFSPDGTIDYLQGLIDACRSFGHEGKFAWLMFPAYPATSFSALHQNGDAMMNGIIDAAKRVMEDHPDITLLMPSGTALHNARKTRLNNYGTCSTHEMFFEDNKHLQAGIGPLIEAYAVVMSLMGTDGDYPFLETIRWPRYKHGTEEGLNPEDEELARLCAIKAVDDPWHYGPPVAVEDIYGNDQPTTGDVYTIDGRLVLHNAQNLDGLPAGIYITGHRKVVVK